MGYGLPTYPPAVHQLNPHPRGPDMFGSNVFYPGEQIPNGSVGTIAWTIGGGAPCTGRSHSLTVPNLRNTSFLS